MKKISTEALIGLGVGLGVLAATAIGVFLTLRGGAAGAVRPVVAGETVILLGDSLGVGITSPLAAELARRDIALSAVPRTGWNARQVAGLYTSSGDLAGAAVVVSLGSNDAAMFDPSSEAPDVQAIVETAFARGARRLVWIVPPNYLSASPPSPATPQKQAAFAALWSDPRVERLQAPADALAADGIHLSPSGYQALAELVARALTP